MQWNPFKKKDPKQEEEQQKLEAALEAMPGAKDMNMFQKFAMKRVMDMSPEERAKVMQKAMKPENVQKHKKEILEQLETMKRMGQMSDDQYRLAKRKLGL
ncbi:MAG: hypothetical protein E6R05_07285 [Candidatus Moraniibacteriota bacterium]|nr:MAG: hypothetical protein E6R05_07285 [Candidatus Moranbacteria bacterium]